MSEKPKNPSAFAAASLADWQSGMSLRDWFAGQALAGMLAANAQTMDEVNDKNVDAVIAREAYRSADAMLLEREKP